jgi:ceramide glucosyltransferase
MEHIVFWLFGLLSILGLTGYFLQLVAVRSKLVRKQKMAKSLQEAELLILSPITVIKPLKGLDDNLFDNLSSFCTQDYPAYEVIFALQDANDAAYKVVQKVKSRHPECDITVLVEHCATGLNPKVNNLMPACKKAKYEQVLISDSNVMVGKDYLKETARHMRDPRVGLVTNIIRGIRARSLGSLFENLHLNSFIIGSVCFLDRYLNMPCVIGKSMLMRKKDLETIGGFDAVKDVLAEDYVIGKLIHEQGKKVVLSEYAVNNINEFWSLGKFMNRHTRWGKLRWQIGGIKYFSELIGNAVFMAYIPLFLTGFSASASALAFGVSWVKILGDMYLGRKTSSGMNPLAYLLAPLKDLIIGCIWFIPLLSNTVVWRGNRYLIGKDSMLSPCPENGILSWRYRIADVIKTRIAWSMK